MKYFFVSLTVSVALFVSWLFIGSGMYADGNFTFTPTDRFDGRVAGVTAPDPVPVVDECRDQSSDFLPIKKPGMGQFAVPTAYSAVLLDATTGRALFQQDANEHRAIASITKLMTTMIVVESVKNLDEPVTIQEDAVYAEGTRVGCPRSGYCVSERLHVGEKVSVRNLLKAALMNSANDAAIALAEHISGSQDAFAKKMNDRAAELGLENTHFCTPSGLELDDAAAEENCYSSALDVAKIASYALHYDILWETMRLPGTTIPSTDGKYEHTIFNTDPLIGQYPNLVGTKTGFTPRAGYSLLAVAKDPASAKHILIAVVLNDPSRWQSVQSMLSWGFSAYEWL
ncbi:MAG: D-alanyl-D-alanine carboxypeptidase family protein [Candidatus Moraniibacteriota bacterium]